MPSETFEQLLDRAAALCGVEAEFWDIWGRHHATSVAAKQAILRAKGFAADDAASLDRSLAAVARREWMRLLPPVLVQGETDAVMLSLNLPADSVGLRARIAVRPENGPASEFELNPWELPQSAYIEMDGQTWVRKQARLPVALPLGYHEIAAQVGALSASMRCIVTPEPRVYASPSGTRRAHRGNRREPLRCALGAQLGLRRFSRSAGGDRLGGGGPGGQLRGPQSPARHPQSPAFQYQPLPAELHFLPELPLSGCGGHGGFRGVAARPPVLRTPAATQAEIEALRQAPFVEYERVAALKLRLLKLLFAAISARAAARLGARPRVRSLPGARGRPAGEVRHVLRAR